MKISWVVVCSALSAVLDASYFRSYPETYRMYPYGGDRSGYQGGPVCDGTRQYQCDDGCLQSRYGAGKD